MARSTGRDAIELGSVLGRSLGVLQEHGPALLMVSTVLQIPTLLLGLSGIGVPHAGSPHAHMTAGIVAGLAIKTLVSFALDMLALAIMTCIAYAALNGEPVYLTEAVEFGLRLAVPMALAYLLSGLLVVIGFALLIVPGILLGAEFIAAGPASVIEGLGAVASLRRSRDLVKGSRTQILGLFGLMVAFSLLLAGLNVFVRMALGNAGSAIFMFVEGSIVAAAYAVAFTAIYDDLRLNEGRSW